MNGGRTRDGHRVAGGQSGRNTKPGGIRCSRRERARRLLGHAERRGTDSWAGSGNSGLGRTGAVGLHAAGSRGRRGRRSELMRIVAVAVTGALDDVDVKAVNYARGQWERVAVESFSPARSFDAGAGGRHESYGAERCGGERMKVGAAQTPRIHAALPISGGYGVAG